MVLNRLAPRPGRAGAGGGASVLGGNSTCTWAGREGRTGAGEAQLRRQDSGVWADRGLPWRGTVGALPDAPATCS